MRICVKVQRIPPRKAAISTMRKPSKLNWVDWNVNMKRPPEISSTTRINSGFWWDRQGWIGEKEPDGSQDKEFKRVRM